MHADKGSHFASNMQKFQMFAQYSILRCTQTQENEHCTMVVTLELVLLARNTAMMTDLGHNLA